MSKEVLDQQKKSELNFSKEDIRNSDLKQNFQESVLGIKEKLEKNQTLLRASSLTLEENRAEIGYNLGNSEVTFDITYKKGQKGEVIINVDYELNQISDTFDFDDEDQKVFIYPTLESFNKNFTNDLGYYMQEKVNNIPTGNVTNPVYIRDDKTDEQIDKKRLIATGWMIHDVQKELGRLDPSIREVKKSDKGIVQIPLTLGNKNYDIFIAYDNYLVGKAWDMIDSENIHYQVMIGGNKGSNTDINDLKDVEFSGEDNLVNFCDYMWENYVDEKVKKAVGNEQHTKVYPKLAQAYKLLHE